MTSSQQLFLTIFVLLFLVQDFCLSLQLVTLTPDHPIKDGDVLISGKKTFALGFFSPGNSAYRYVGIWYNKVPERTVVWVANRDNPLNDTSGVLAITQHGGLVIYEKNQSSTPLWSTNVSVAFYKNSMVKLLDVGNLVLFQNNQSQTLLWQSFDYPTDTMLSFMKLGLKRRSGLNWFLNSWKSADNPGTGNCSFRIDPSGYPQAFLYNGNNPLWRLGPWTGNRWSGVPEMTPKFIFNISFVNNQDEISFVYGILNDTIFTRMLIDQTCTLRRSTWRDQDGQWVEFFSGPRDWCDHYGKCGFNGNCDPSNTNNFACKCLSGFEPKSGRDWYLRDWSGGCVRKQGVRTCGNGEGFVKLGFMKAPDTSKARVNMSLGLKECQQLCLSNCSCTAYMSADENRGGIGCLTWHGDLMDTRTYPTTGQDLYVRVDAATLAEYIKKSKSSIGTTGKVAISLGSVVVLFLVAFLAFWMDKRRRKAKERQSKYTFNMTPSSSYHEEFLGKTEFDKGRSSNLPFFDLNTIAAATNNFSIDNKLGEGGFGLVYKGMLYDGREVAVKRLSMNSGQGVEEFKNEVTLIAKLQHRNLVRILGYCVKGVEKMLIYEYLPNKSLDFFIFDETKRELLDWRKRFDIICGVARGILYIHQDSILRIIHRDLKASNILLDADMNPKIADFGMARIFGVDQIEANTNRVVGTYGYMSPEYAMEGRFSTKSDVYSFGVLLLEIITGKKNIGFYHLNLDSNLVGHIWDLWIEGRAIEIVDSSLNESVGGEALRCIQIGLLCVQEFASDRPKMSAVISMLENDVALSSPTKPGFVFKRKYTSGDPSSSEGAISTNDVTCSMVEAR
ncbi:hypothetical protein UlMin_011671 [Ulmus minor]